MLTFWIIAKINVSFKSECLGRWINQTSFQKLTWSSIRIKMMCGWFFLPVSPVFTLLLFMRPDWDWADRKSKLRKTLSTVAAARIVTAPTGNTKQDKTISTNTRKTEEKRTGLKNVWVGTVSHEHAIAAGRSVDHKTTFGIDLPTWLKLWPETHPSAGGGL